MFKELNSFHTFNYDSLENYLMKSLVPELHHYIDLIIINFSANSEVLAGLDAGHRMNHAIQDILFRGMTGAIFEFSDDFVNLTLDQKARFLKAFFRLARVTYFQIDQLLQRVEEIALKSVSTNYSLQKLMSDAVSKSVVKHEEES